VQVSQIKSCTRTCKSPLSPLRYLSTTDQQAYGGSETIPFPLEAITDDQNRVNYLLTPSPQGDLCVAKLFPPDKPNPNSSSSVPTMKSNQGKSNVVRCEASRDLRWTIENTGVMSPIYKIVNQDETPLYQISKPNPNADFWTMFYFKYAGHQIPPKRVEVCHSDICDCFMLTR